MFTKNQLRNYLHIFCFLCLLFLVTACAGPTITIEKFPGKKLFPVAICRVEVITTDPPKRPYKEIGTITVERDSASETYDEIIRMIRVRAAALGAHAIIIDPQSKVSNTAIAKKITTGLDVKIIKATVIRWTD
ncbi:MAG: hypothetical protein ITD27_01495 [Nitrosospira sp.]|nr:hypothetical protein [Nitrosospira sp.]MBI0419055.1 hypothetical protein [Nitrosospira sp.]MDW7664244.1 hypothetical protein [Nitrosomonadaceae bacterium]